jgi:hypothetical protein
MEIDDIPGNRKGAPKKVAPTEEPRPKVARTVQGAVTTRKKPLGKRMRDTFLGGEDAKGVGQFIAAEVIVPAIKDAISDAVTQGIERILFPDSAPRSRNHRSVAANAGRQAGRVAYERMSSSSIRQPREERTMSREARRNHDFGEIVIPTRAEAIDTLDQMYELISKFDQVSVGEFYDMCGYPGEPTDERWGWERLDGATVHRARGGGYVLNLPRPEPL